MAKMIDAPFVKCEATKFTEVFIRCLFCNTVFLNFLSCYCQVGFHGRDVDTIIRDLVQHSMTLTKKKLRQQVCCCCCELKKSVVN
jgi:ATP-dependent HslUV protease ATP-binding subunit HslU